MSANDFTQLLENATDYAVDQLCTDCYFVPFAVVLDPKGRLRRVIEDAQHLATPEETVSFILEDLRREAGKGKYRATAIASSSRILHPDSGEEIDAIQVACEHESSQPVIGYVPYTIEDHKLVLGELIWEEGENEIFPP